VLLAWEERGVGVGALPYLPTSLFRSYVVMIHVVSSAPRLVRDVAV
jgi:hypothetical protein